MWCQLGHSVVVSRGTQALWHSPCQSTLSHRKGKGLYSSPQSAPRYCEYFWAPHPNTPEVIPRETGATFWKKSLGGDTAVPQTESPGD